jgi:hypothetical protein
VSTFDGQQGTSILQAARAPTNSSAAKAKRNPIILQRIAKAHGKSARSPVPAPHFPFCKDWRRLKNDYLELEE